MTTRAAASIAVVAPLRVEIAPLIRRLRRHRRQRSDTVRWHEGSLHGHAVVAAGLGDGRRAADTLATLLAAVEIDRLIIVGVAGGLSPALNVGDVVAARTVRDETGVAPDPCFWFAENRAIQTGVAMGTLITSRRVATTSVEKTSLWREHGAPVPATVDLETAVLARVAHDARVSYMALRVVSDPVDETLPLDFNDFADEAGHVRQGAVAWHALRHPRLIPSLRRLGRRVDRCAERLADVVDHGLRPRP